MISLTKKTDYALIALAYLAERPGRVASAREIAEARDLPAALLMNILKELQHHGLLRSTRGVKGGYEITADLAAVSLHELVVALEGPVKLVECAGESAACQHATNTDAVACRVSGHCAVQAPLQALHQRLVRFLGDVRLADVVFPNAGNPKSP
jgi:Rrf2 family protein